MELSLFFLCLVIISSAAEPVENILSTVGGNITLREPVKEYGFLIYKGKNIAVVFDGKMKIFEEGFKRKLMWNTRTGLFTITNIQKNHSGTYKIDNEKPKMTRIFNISVYDPLPLPSVRRSNVDPANCSLLCYVDGAPPQARVLWLKGQKEVIHNSSYVLLTISEENLNSSYTCAAQSPVENKTVEVEVITLCGNNKMNDIKMNDDNNTRHRLLLIFILIPVCVVVALIAVCVITRKRFIWKRKRTQETMDSEQDVTHAEVQVRQHIKVAVSCPNFSTVYSVRQPHSKEDDNV